MDEIQRRIQSYQEEFLSDLQRLIQIPSIRDETTKHNDQPFGKAIREAMDCFCDIAKRCGFETDISEGYACHAQIGDGDDYIGVLGHLDVVDVSPIQEWKSDPFTLTMKDDFLYGRGVNDDKGPLLASLYATRIIHDMNIPLRYPIRVIAGGAEETTWECMEHYFHKYPQPKCGFSPDGNFPIVNGEKGILCFSVAFPSNPSELEIECKEHENWVNDDIKVCFKQKQIIDIERYAKHVYKIIQQGEDAILYYRGKRAMSRNPQRGENALWSFVHDFKNYPFQQDGDINLMKFFHDCLFEDFYGKKAGIYTADKEMGTTSICPCSIRQTKQGKEIYIDIRFVNGITKEDIEKQMHALGAQYHGQVELRRYKRMLFVDEQSHLIQALKKAYQTVMKEEPHVLTKGGASYARVLDHGVAFGATFEHEDPKPHMPNENQNINSLWKAMHIYVESLIELAGQKEL